MTISSGWTLLWTACECGAPLCESGFLLAQPDGADRWLVLAVASDREWMDDQLATAQLSLDGDEQFERVCRELLELYGWPWPMLDETLSCAMYARMMDISDELSDELAHWGAEGVRDFRRLAGEAPASCEAALLCVRRHRLDVGGERVTAGPLAT